MSSFSFHLSTHSISVSFQGSNVSTYFLNDKLLGEGVFHFHELSKMIYFNHFNNQLYFDYS